MLLYLFACLYDCGAVFVCVCVLVRSFACVPVVVLFDGVIAFVFCCLVVCLLNCV